MAETTSELERYLQATPKSKGLWENAKNYLPGGDSRNSIFWPPYPIFVDHASGCHVVDADGMDRLDFIGTMTTLILGHAPKPVVDVVRQQLEHGVVYNAPNSHQISLAKLLCERIPSFDLVRFTNSGTEATLNTIRAARAVTGKSKIAKVEGGYHGSHDQVSVSVRVNPAKAGARSRPDALAATEGLGEGTLDQVVVLPFNETATARQILEENKDQLAAVIIEPMLGSVGMLPATTEFLTMLREFTKDNGIILIFDEVISYRASSGGAQEYYDITPDMTALGKIIGGGFSIGAFGGRKDIMDLYDPTAPGGPRVAHAGTFNANPLTMLAGTATLEQLTPEVYRKLAEMTDYLRAGKVVGRGQLAAPEPVVVDLQRVRHHQPWVPVDLSVIGQVVVVGVAVVDEPAFRHHQFPGVHAGSVTRVPPQRPLPGGAGDGGHGLMDGLPFSLPVHLVVFFPSVAVTHYLVPPADDLRPHCRVALQCQGAGKEGRVDAILVQQVQDAPDSYPAPILEERLVCQVPLSPGYRRRRLANRLAVRVPIQDGIFRPLLVVDDKRYGNPGAIGPFHHRRISLCGLNAKSFPFSPGWSWPRTAK